MEVKNIVIMLLYHSLREQREEVTFLVKVNLLSVGLEC